MKKVEEKAYAKINLVLNIGDLRPDGYHDIQTIMQSLELHDDVTVEQTGGTGITVTASVDTIPTDESNLAAKAVKAFAAKTGVPADGLSIHIEKRIPVAAGLGGGSADAAAVLRALNRHFDSPLSILALAELGARVGSDVPFCVVGGTAMVEGRGERLRKLPDMPECVFVVCKPEFSVSTPELYQKLDTVAIPLHPDNRAMETALLAGDLNKIADNVYNVFDPVVTADHLELNYIKSICNSYGSLGQQMTGSGSAVFAIMPSFEYGAVVCNMLKENYSEIFLAKPV